MSLSTFIKQKALELGFDLAGITDAGAIQQSHRDHFEKWLSRDYAAQMSYLRRNVEKRLDPSKLMPGARSVIVVALNYTPPPNDEPTDARLGRVANYARYRDYHTFIKQLLRKLASVINERTGTACRFKICVDSVPLAERSLAVKAGLGFIGKNHMLINPDFGPNLLLGEIITNLSLRHDKAVTETCDDCDACVRACPTGALRADGFFDASRCISYLTTEHAGDIPDPLRGFIANRLFGCDCCTLSCSWQLKAMAADNRRFTYHADRAWLDLENILRMTPEQFEQRFADSVLLRPGLQNLKRNARICLDNLNHFIPKNSKGLNC